MILSCGLVILATALAYVQGKLKTGYWFGALVLLPIIISQVPRSSRVSDDKDLPQLLAMPESIVVAKRYSPQGKLEIVEAPAFHAAPGLALNTIEPVPPQRFITVDALIVDTIYQTTSADDFAFLDQTTQALPYQLGHFNHALIIDDAGTSHLGLALYHQVAKVTTLISNGALADLKMKELSSLSSYIHTAAQLSFITTTVRGYLRTSSELYPLIIFPTIGTDPGGLSAAAADSLLTQETLRLCLAHLDEQGVLAASTFVHSPPRESLRLLNMFARALREIGKEPRHHIAVIRNWATVTIVVSKRPLTTQQLNNIRSFSQQRGFDLVWLPDINPHEVNRYHQFQKASYHRGATLLLGSQNAQFVTNYIYDLSPPDDDRPFFHHFSRWQGMRELKLQLGKRGRVFWELGWLLLIAAFCQALLLALICILLPLVPAVGLPGRKTEQVAILGFFSAIGFGFMLLEMGFLQRLTVYLAHPVYAAATVLSGFLVFGGIGSIISSKLQEPLELMHRNLGIAIVIVGGAILMLGDGFLLSTESKGLVSRIALACILIAPLAILMGMMFPLGLKRVGRSQKRLIPWAWGANGFTSVMATIAAPILAMQWGFDLVAWTALGCYGLATLLSLKLPC
jgi:spermidine synthase